MQQLPGLILHHRHWRLLDSYQFVRDGNSGDPSSRNYYDLCRDEWSGAEFGVVHDRLFSCAGDELSSGHGGDHIKTVIGDAATDVIVSFREGALDKETYEKM